MSEPASFLARLDGLVGRHITLGILLFAALGVAFPEELSFLVRIAPVLFAFMTFSNGLSGGLQDLVHSVRRPLPVFTVLVLLHLLLPPLALGVGTFFFPSSPLFTTGLVLQFAIPTGVISLMWVSLARGNDSLCLSILLLDTLCAPVVVPWTMKLLAGSVVAMDTFGMLKDLTFMVALPALAAMCLHDLRGHGKAEALKSTLSPFSKLAMLLVGTANATGCAPFLRNLNHELVLVILVSFGLCGFGFLLGYLAGTLLHQDVPTVRTMTLNTGLRNINAGTVLALTYFPADVLFPVAFAPLFIQPMASCIVSLLLRMHVRTAEA